MTIDLSTSCACYFMSYHRIAGVKRSPRHNPSNHIPMLCAFPPIYSAIRSLLYFFRSDMKFTAYAAVCKVGGEFIWQPNASQGVVLSMVTLGHTPVTVPLTTCSDDKTRHGLLYLAAI